MMREHYASERIAGQRSKKGNGTHNLQLKQLQRNQTYELNRPGTGTPVYTTFLLRVESFQLTCVALLSDDLTETRLIKSGIE